jgi:hypothetical protein
VLAITDSFTVDDEQRLIVTHERSKLTAGFDVDGIGPPRLPSTVYLLKDQVPRKLEFKGGSG